MRRALLILVGVVATIIVLVIAGVVVLTRSDWGHERLRRFTLGMLNDMVHGRVQIGEVRGNLLDGVTLVDVSITDSAGAPFLSADTLHARYTVRTFLKRRVELADVRLVRPLVVFSKLPGSHEWNFERIFPSDTTPDAPSEKPGFGDWVAFNDVTIVDGRLHVRMPWTPDSELTPAGRDSAITEALGRGTRSHVVSAPGGFQQLQDYRALNATFPRLRLNHPDSSGMAFQVASLSVVAAPFNPPEAEVRDLVGTFFVVHDTLSFNGITAVLPGSRITGGGSYDLDGGELRLRLRGAPAALADLRWIYPRLPSQGGGSLDFALIMPDEGVTTYEARNADIAIGASRLGGSLGISVSDSGVRFHDTDLSLSRFDTRLIEQLAPSARIPRRGAISGRARLAGSLDALLLDTDLAFDDARNGTSRVVASGEVGFTRGFRARDLRVRMMPLQVDLARIAIPSLPIGGTINGTATIAGSTTTRFTAVTDVVHLDRGARSHLAGRGVVVMGSRPWMDIDLRARPIALATVGRFAPSLGLHGFASGPIRVRGATSDLRVHGDLRLPDGGALRADARLGLVGEPSYDATATLTVFDLGAMFAWGPRTSLTAVASGRGRGFDPARMRASFAVDAAGSQYDSIAVDSLRVRVAVADGMATVETFRLAAPFAQATIEGTVGLAAGRDGDLSYSVQIDSLSGLRRWIAAADTSKVTPRPARMAKRIKEAREDSARVAEATEVERAVTGGAAPMLKVDSIVPVRVDSVAGRLAAAGTLRGNISRFELRGRAAVENVIARGNAINRGRIEYGWFAGGSPDASLAIAASLDTVQAAGFALDSVELRTTFRPSHGDGSIDLLIHQHESQEVRAVSDFALHTDHRELHLRRMALRFDTATWTTSRPGAIQWGQRGITLRTIELRHGTDGRIFLNGTIPTAGQADLEIAISGLQVANIVDLLQGSLAATGVLTLAARVEGTTRDPRFRGAAAVVGASYGGTALPDMRTRFNYAGQRLDALAEVLRGTGQPVAVAEATLPVNLALAGVTGSRLPANRDMQFELRADSLPLDVVPKFTDAVSDVRGKVVGILAGRGPVRSPTLTGALALDFASFRIVPLGVTLRNINGMVHIRGDTLVIDSLVGYSGGPIRVRGGLDLARLTQPGFDLDVVAGNALVLDNERGRLRADIGIEITGPYDHVYIAGGANIRNGVIYIPEPENKDVINAGDPAVFSVVDTSVVADREVLPAQSSMLANLRMDVDLRVSRDTWVRTSEANVEVYTPEQFGGLTIHVDRAKRALILEGAVSTDRGEYNFLGRRFVIRRGSATFVGDPEINPLLQITAEHEVQLSTREAFEIRVIIGGTLDKPRLTLESSAEPPIPQSDLLAYLAFGRPSSSLLQVQSSALSSESGAGGNLVGNVAALAARQISGVAIDLATQELETDMARSLGADVFDVRPTEAPAELSTETLSALTLTQVEAGKYLNTRTFVAVRAQPALARPLGARMEYRMNRGLRFEGSFEPRYILQAPSLSPTTPEQRTVYGAFVIREWRF